LENPSRSSNFTIALGNSHFRISNDGSFHRRRISPPQDVSAKQRLFRTDTSRNKLTVKNYIDFDYRLRLYYKIIEKYLLEEYVINNREYICIEVKMHNYKFPAIYLTFKTRAIFLFIYFQFIFLLF